MKHIKLFESFGDSNEKFRVTITLDSENPDASYGCEVEGIGDTLEEAARFAFALVCKFIVSGDDLESLRDLSDFEDITENIYSKAEVEEAISSIVQGKGLESDFFADHGTSSTNTVEVDTGRFPENGGFIIDQYSDNKY